MNFNFNGSNVTINVSQKEFARISDVLVETGSVETENVNTFTLTDNELYMLKCLLHHVSWDGEIKSLLEKFVGPDDEDYTMEDYSKVVFEKDAFNDTTIRFVEEDK